MISTMYIAMIASDEGQVESGRSDQRKPKQLVHLLPPLKLCTWVFQHVYNQEGESKIVDGLDDVGR